MGKEKKKRKGTSRRIVSMEPGADPPFALLSRGLSPPFEISVKKNSRTLERRRRGQRREGPA